MAILKISQTRMTMLKLRRELATAKHCHKLLKYKHDCLIKSFIKIINEAHLLRLEIEQEMSEVFSRFLKVSSAMDPRMIDSALSFPESKLELEVYIKNVMSVKIPEFTVNFIGNLITYGFVQTSGELDEGLILLKKVLPKLIKLAEIEKHVEIKAEEIEKIKRIINSLVYTMITNYKDTIKFIQIKLDEQERENIITAMNYNL